MLNIPLNTIADLGTNISFISIDVNENNSIIKREIFSDMINKKNQLWAGYKRPTIDKESQIN